MRLATISETPRFVRLCGYFPFLLLFALVDAFFGAMIGSRVLLISAGLFGLISFVQVMVLIFFTVLFSLQWRLLELMIVLAVGTIPMGLYAKGSQNQIGEVSAKLVAGMALIWFGGFVATMVGALVGLGLASKFNEQRAIPRLVYILLGWMFLIGAGAVGAVLFLWPLSRSDGEYHLPTSIWILATFWIPPLAACLWLKQKHSTVQNTVTQVNEPIVRP
jgi:hypothetical protein